MKETLTVEIKPKDGALCGDCPQLIGMNPPPLYFCRQFSSGFGFIDHCLDVNERGDVERCAKCLELDK